MKAILKVMKMSPSPIDLQIQTELTAIKPMFNSKRQSDHLLEIQVKIMKRRQVK